MTSYTNGQQPHSYDETRVAGSSKSQPLVNGYASVEATSQIVEPEPPINEAQFHSERTVSHLYEYGFQHGNYSDTTLHIGSAVYRLHAIILSRSPYLVHLMSTSPYKNMVYIPLEQYPDVTLEALAIALGWLYSYDALKMLTQGNARATLASACLLGGMDDLCMHAYAACKESIRLDTIEDWLTWLDTHPQPYTSNSPGPSGPSTPRSPSPQSVQDLGAASIFGPYAQLLRNDVFEFLIVSLPAILFADAETKPEVVSEAHEALLRVFSRVSFDIFKMAMESPRFHIGSDHDRFRFAKSAIVRRKQLAGRDAEESVVLAVGQGKGNVHVTRKLRRKALWKVAK